MTGTALARPVSSIAWELRTAWATGRRVSLSLSPACAPRTRVEGWVRHVAATSASVTVAGLSVPLDQVLAVHLPSRLGDSTVRGEFHGPGHAETRPGQLSF